MQRPQQEDTRVYADIAHNCMHSDLPHSNCVHCFSTCISGLPISQPLPPCPRSWPSFTEGLGVVGPASHRWHTCRRALLFALAARKRSFPAESQGTSSIKALVLPTRRRASPAALGAEACCFGGKDPEF